MTEVGMTILAIVCGILYRATLNAWAIGAIERDILYPNNGHDVFKVILMSYE
jgi:hypothetical protein